VTELPDLSRLSHEEKDALILALWAQVQALTARVAELEAQLGSPPKTPSNSSLPPSRGQKPNRAEKARRCGRRQGSLGRTGGGRVLAASPDEVVTARPVRCAHCDAPLSETDQKLHGRYDKVDLPKVAPVVTRVERYAGQCRCCGATTLAPLPEGLEPGTPFSGNIVALALCLRVVHACLAHQLRDCQFAIDAGDAIFAPRMKALLLRAVVLARRHRSLAESTRREYRRRLDHDLDAIMALAPANRHGQRLRRRYGKVREHLFTFLDHPEVAADNNGSERELRPTATYRKVTGGFRSDWGADLFAGVRSVIGTAKRRGIDAYQAVHDTLRRQPVLAPG
jgi:hypothetical protein